MFTASQTGNYTIDVAGVRDKGSDYLLTAVEANPDGLVFTNDEIAWQLVTNGNLYFRNPAAMAFDVGEDNTLSVNLAHLTPVSCYLARLALRAWTNVTGSRLLRRRKQQRFHSPTALRD